MLGFVWGGEKEIAPGAPYTSKNRPILFPEKEKRGNRIPWATLQ